ncbi:MAG: polyribonucleotide nucleotidyltransferase [Flavobacteriales bacterium CG18_big_fil_WC_8_21_14_2_50_32_9]|nr:MAG: polyribonucleotide nucleotidyltransferase [Flavobacteriales bacterium CG18_big_fil_WC_8_21_14_2_50_32_9]PJC63198.1 MAG: polyribonucleotide nucleotidyltransferase [Flavobacteriales bacterium CG_4_9_14_0_2_um_filter_32_27]
MSKIGIKKSYTLGDGRTIEIETGKLAKQAHGSVVLKMGDTMLLAVVVSDKEAAEGTDFLPLTVEYKEKYAAAGRFPGGFLKREARPSDSEVLVCRLIDRAMRPLFPDNFHANTSVVVNLISHGDDTLPDALACFAASAAIAVSDIPFNGPTSEVRIGRINGEFVINPTRTALESSDIDMIIAGTLENINMVEGEMLEISEAEMLEAIKIAHAEIKKQCQLQLDLAAEVEKSKVKRDYSHEPEPNVELEAKIKAAIYDKCYAVAKEGNADKVLRAQKFKAIAAEGMANLNEEELTQTFLLKKYFHDIEKEAVRDCVLQERTRLDGRKLNEIRPIWSEVDYLPGAHGSAIFTRGETQSLTTVTLGNRMDEQMIDAATFKDTSKFILHYNFPAYCTGEAYPNRGTSRREIGHGNLAMRALKPMIPTGAENPYTVRIVSEILESNGSSSMATVCAGTLALMDAGVQIKRPVSGIAMGLISKGEKYAVLSDILGDEDHLGDMDFKVTGTSKGITACQMDIKVDGLSYQVLEEALAQAKEGRAHILGEIAKTLAEPNKDYKPHTPRITQITIPKEMIGAVIGPGGKIIQEIQASTGATITIEEKDNQGVVSIMTNDGEAMNAALSRIKAITAVPEVGEIYKGKVKSITNFGAFVEIIPGKDGLLHISEINWDRVEKVEDVLKEGEMIDVKLIEVDAKTGKLKLSRKVLLEKPKKENA